MSRVTHPDLLPALVLVLVGGWALWEASQMSTFGAVFPTLASGGMILGGLALAIRAVLFRPPIARPEGELARPLVMLGLLACWAVLLPVLGFIIASFVGALSAMVLGLRDNPGAPSIIRQSIALIALVGIVAFLFGTLLKVPLP